MYEIEWINTERAEVYHPDGYCLATISARTKAEAESKAKQLRQVADTACFEHVGDYVP